MSSSPNSSLASLKGADSTQSDSQTELESSDSCSVSQTDDNVSNDPYQLSVDQLKSLAEDLSKRCEEVTSILWHKKASEEASKKRKRVFTMPLRKKYKNDRQLEANQETKMKYQDICHKTDQASQNAIHLNNLQLQLDKKLLALTSERDHAQTMVAVWSKRLKSVRAQLVDTKNEKTKTLESARKARKVAADSVKNYNMVRRTLKQKVSMAQHAALLAKKEEEIRRLKQMQDTNKSLGQKVYGPTHHI